MSFVLEGFDIGDSIGSGGFGEVWAARQIGVDRAVAIKVGHLPMSETKDRLRFERECKALGRLSSHPNIATVHTSGTLPDGRPYLVLEYVDGGDLLSWATTTRASEAQILAIGIDLASAVAAAHGFEIIHRDLKPENLLLRSTGEAVLGDFGIAHMQDGLRTVTGNVTASVAYAAPEILSGTRATEAADVYGIGICILVAATGTVPFTEPTDESLHPVLTRVLTTPPPSLVELGFSSQLDALVQSMLSKNPEERPISAEKVAEELQAIADGGVAPTRPSPQSTMSRIPVEVVPPELPADVPPAFAPTEAAVAASPSPPSIAEADQTAVRVPTPPQTSFGETVVVPSAEGGSIDQNKLIFGAIAAVLVIGLLLVFALNRGDNSTSTTDTTTGDAGTQSTGNASSSGSDAGSGVGAGDNIDPDGIPATSTGPGSIAPRDVIDVAEPILISDSIDIALDFRAYPIGLAEGQAVSLAVTDMGRGCDRGQWDMRVFFLGPDGEEIGNARPGNVGCGGFGGVEWSAAVDGVHTVEVRAGDSIGEKTGSFEAVLAILKQETYEYDGNGVAVIEGEIDIARDVDDYEVDLQAGQSVSIAITEMGAGCDRGQWDLRVEFLDPSGAEIEDGWPGNEGCKAFGGLSWTARETGTHTVRVTSGDEFDLATGIYEGVIGLLQKEVKGTIDRDTPLEVAGEITVPFDYHDYLIELDQGEAVGVWTRSMGPEDCSRGQWDIRIWFLDPEGEELGDAWPGNNGCGGDGGIDWAAEESGTHVLRIGSGGGSVGDPIGVYDGRIAVLRQEVKPKLDAGAGVQLSDTIDLPLDVHYYPIDLAAGQAVSIDVTSMGDDGCSRAQWDMRIALLDADRNELQDGWPGNSSCRVFGGSDWAVDEGGEYLLAIFGGDSLPVPNGSYEVTVGVVSAR